MNWPFLNFTVLKAIKIEWNNLFYILIRYLILIEFQLMAFQLKSGSFSKSDIRKISDGVYEWVLIKHDERRLVVGDLRSFIRLHRPLRK